MATWQGWNGLKLEIGLTADDDGAQYFHVGYNNVGLDPARRSHEYGGAEETAPTTVNATPIPQARAACSSQASAGAEVPGPYAGKPPGPTDSEGYEGPRPRDPGKETRTSQVRRRDDRRQGRPTTAKNLAKHQATKHSP